MADLLFDTDVNAGMDFLQKKATKASDGLYRPDLKNSKDKTKGYRATLRFLPNFQSTDEGVKRGTNAIEKIIHYVKLQNHQNLNGYYDSMKNFNEKCALTDTFWDLKNSKSVIENEKAELISRSIKWYSYVLVLDDEVSENIGKIMIFSYGKTVKEKIAQELTGEITGTVCNVFDLAAGKDFKLVIKEKGGFPNYDFSNFVSNTTPIKLEGKDIPVEENSDGVLVVKQKLREPLIQFLLKRDANLEDYSPKRWTEEQTIKVDQIVSILTNAPMVNSNKQTVSKNDFLSNASNVSIEDVDAVDAVPSTNEDDDFFNSLR